MTRFFLLLAIVMFALLMKQMIRLFDLLMIKNTPTRNLTLVPEAGPGR